MATHDAAQFQAQNQKLTLNYSIYTLHLKYQCLSNDRNNFSGIRRQYSKGQSSLAIAFRILTDYISPSRAQREFQFSKKFFYILVKQNGLAMYNLRRKRYVRRSEIEKLMKQLPATKHTNDENEGKSSG